MATATDQSKSQATSTASSKKKTSTAAKKKTTASKSHKPRAKVSAARAQQLRRQFVASSDLRPMARQLIQFRTPAAYAGVQSYANIHAGTEAGALAWFAIGYAHYLDAQYPAAIAAMEKAAPKMGGSLTIRRSLSAIRMC